MTMWINVRTNPDISPDLSIHFFVNFFTFLNEGRKELMKNTVKISV